MTNGRQLLWSIVMMVSAGAALGQATWNVSSGNWTNAGNWVGGVVPSNTNVVINNGGLATLTNVAPTLGAGHLYVGSNGVGNRLVVTNGGSLNHGVGYIGFAAGSSNNVVRVTGTGSVWRSTGDVRVGESGSGNQLVISGGGLVTNGNGGGIGINASSSNNVMSISGTGSVWRSVGGVVVGADGSGNQLVISGGAVVTNGGLRAVGSLGSNNVASVSGTGSVWIGSGDVVVGQAGSGNRLNITNGGVVRGGLGYVGFSGMSNVVNVTGTGSVWQTTSLDVGFLSRDNRLEIGVGGLVTNSGAGSVGFNSVSVNNTVIVSGAGARWRSVGSQVVGSIGAGNQLIITNGGLSASGADGYLGIEPGATNNLVVVAGTGSVWSVSGTVHVGSMGFPCRMVVADGGMVSNRVDAYIGHQTGLLFLSMSNTVAVTGTGSVWRIQRDLVVGVLGSGNQMRIERGGMVSNGGGAMIGNLASVTNLSGVVTTSSNNFVTVDGPGSRWDLKGSLTLGNFASGNQLLITNGAAVAVGSNLVIGATLTSSNSLVIVADSASSLTVGGALTINRGTNIQRGATVTTGSLVVTNSAGAYLLQGGTLNITNGGVISSGGSLAARGAVNGNVTIGASGTLTVANEPGACAQSGTMTWQGGGAYRWTINGATGPAGTNRDIIAITGNLALSATPSNRFLIQVVGLDPTNAVGAVAGFDNSVPYSWPVVTATAGFAGFDTNAVLLDTSSFTTKNGVIGSLRLVPSGNSLNLVYTPLLSFSTDTDGDGLSDAAESQWANLGFDWQVSQPTLVSNFLANASRASLYTPAQVQSLNVGTPLISRNATNGTFTLTIGVQKSTNLTQFAPFPMSAPQTTINGQGRLEFQFSVPDDAAFFRLESE